MWYPAAVRAILKNTAYIGEFHCMGVTIHLPELAVVDRATFDLAQTQFTANKARSVRNRKREYLLAGHIKCACDHAMTGTGHHPSGRRGERVKTKPVIRYYECSTTHQFSSSKRKQVCSERSIRADEDDGDPALLALQADARRIGQQLSSWKREHDRLEADLSDKQMTEAEEQSFLADITALREGMQDADYETKRYYLQRMDVECQLRRDELQQRWLDVSCGLTGDVKKIRIAYDGS
jgi:hypothetical protein